MSLDLDAIRRRAAVQRVSDNPVLVAAVKDRRALLTEVERLREAVRRLDDAVDRHRWAIEQGHDNEPELGSESAKALRDLVALAEEP